MSHQESHIYNELNSVNHQNELRKDPELLMRTNSVVADTLISALFDMSRELRCTLARFLTFRNEVIHDNFFQSLTLWLFLLQQQ